MLVTWITLSAFAAGNVDRVPLDYPTIQDAVKRGTAPVIEVAPGRWAGATVTRPVSIRGLPGAVIASGPRYAGLNIGFALASASSGAQIAGFRFACEGPLLDVGVYSSARRFGTAAREVTVRDNTFHGCVQGVTVAGSPTDECLPDRLDGGQLWTVEGNTFDGFATRADSGADGGGIGVFAFNSREIDVFDNHFVGAVADKQGFTTGGVVVAGCWDCTIASNEFRVDGAKAYWAAISNLGFYQTGAASSRDLLIADNDAHADAAPNLDVNFRSYDSYRTTFDGNAGVVFVDHTTCGDDALETFER